MHPWQEYGQERYCTPASGGYPDWGGYPPAAFDPRQPPLENYGNPPMGWGPPGGPGWPPHMHAPPPGAQSWPSGSPWEAGNAGQAVPFEPPAHGWASQREWAVQGKLMNPQGDLAEWSYQWPTKPGSGRGVVRPPRKVDSRQQLPQPAAAAAKEEEEEEEEDGEQDEDEQESPEAKDKVVIEEDTSVYCPACQTWTNGPKQYEDHLIGKKHRKNMKRQKAESAEAQAAAPAEKVEIKAPPELEETKGKSTEADWLNDGLEELMKTQTRDGKDAKPQEAQDAKRHRRSRRRRGDKVLDEDTKDGDAKDDEAPDALQNAPESPESPRVECHSHSHSHSHSDGDCDSRSHSHS